MDVLSFVVFTNMRYLGVTGIAGTLELDGLQNPQQLEEVLKVTTPTNQYVANIADLTCL